MCLIIDTNVAARVFSSDADTDFQPVRDSLFRPHGLKAKLIYGGKLLEECHRMQDLVFLLVELQRQNRVVFFADDVVNDEEERVAALGICRSNDPHVLALARVSGVRLLCTHDGDLITDFTNEDIIHTPRGKVYQRAEHAPLLARFCKSG